MRRLGVVLLSGGLDSTTVAAYAQEEGYELMALTLYYGQKHRREIDAALQVSAALGLSQQLVDISFFARLAYHSALTKADEFEIPQHRDKKTMASEIPITYVPLRNTLFVTMAAALLESRALDMIETDRINPSDVDASLFIAANALDYSGYPDCRPEYFRKMADALSAGSKLGMHYGRTIRVETPIISMTKTEIVKLGMRLNAPLAYTWSCYEGGDTPCGKCDSCILRATAFAEAGFEDPLLLRLAEDKHRAEGKQVA